jgi:FtsH-binding integral membrane protein
MNSYAARVPVIEALPEDRVEYLKKTGTYTAISLTIAAIAAVASVIFIAPVVGGGWPSLIVILGSFGIAHYVAPKMVFGQQKQAGLILASVAMGVAFGFILLMAMYVSAANLGNPYTLIGQAMAATALTAFGMVGYLWASPKDFSFIGAGLSMLMLPMLGLMVMSFVFPIGGTLGLIMTAGFVVFSAAALLYSTNTVLHELDTSMHVEGAYMMSMALLTLLWNILSLLMRLTSRD